MEKIIGIIFDLDGVIVHTDNYHYQAWKKIADKEGIYFDETINNRLRGVSRAESLKIILEKATKSYSNKEIEKMLEEKNNYYRELLTTMKPSDVSKEVLDTLKSLKEKGYKLAIGSSSKNTKFILEKVNLISFFDAISDGTNIAKSKPDPEVFLIASSLLNIEPEKLAVVEDAFAGIDAANSGNFLSMGLGDAFTYNKTKIKLERFAQLDQIFEHL